MFRLAMAQVLARPMQLHDWLIVGGISAGGLCGLLIIVVFYFPRRKRQRGFNFAAVGASILTSAVVLGTALSTLTFIQRRPLVNSGWFLVAVFGALFASRVLDYLRFRLDRAGQGKPVLEFGRGAPFLNDTKDLAQVAGILALSGTGVIRFFLRMLLNPNALTISLFAVLMGWLGICLLLNRWTPWYVTQRGISVWGGELIEWSEISAFTWLQAKGQAQETLVLTLGDGSKRQAQIKELRGALDEQLKRQILSREAGQH